MWYWWSDVGMDISVWDPYISNSSYHQYWKIQRVAHWVLHDYSRYSSVTSMLHQLQWPSLESRRMKARLFLFYKARNNLIALQIPQYYQTRYNDTRLRHPSSFTYPYIRTSSYVNSFFPKTISMNGTLYHLLWPHQTL